MSKQVVFFLLFVVVAIEVTLLIGYFSNNFYQRNQAMNHYSVEGNVMFNIWRITTHIRVQEAERTTSRILSMLPTEKVSRSAYNRSSKLEVPVGYVLATHYIDQMTGSTVNLFCLQCWASTLPDDVKVVEPFLHYGSMLGFELDPIWKNRHHGDSENTIKLFDMFDERKWRNETSNYNFSDLVSWNDFLQNAPKQLILVDKVCSNSSLCMVCKETDFFESPHFASSAKKFAKYYNFVIVRQVCYEHKNYSAHEFQDLVYDKFSPNQVVVIFNHFGGIEQGDVLRILIDIKKCLRPALFALNFPVHSGILSQSHQYVENYMPNSSTGYISVMFRTEQFARENKFHKVTKDVQMNMLLSCIDVMVQKVKDLKNETGANSIFLSTDTGKYGSAYFRKMDSSHFFHEGVLEPGWGKNQLQENVSNYFFHDGVLKAGLDQLHKSLFGRVIHLNDRIDSVVSFKSPGYVALLEMVLAANGTCLVLAGGGMFHSRVADLHFMQSSQEEMCIHEIYC